MSTFAAVALAVACFLIAAAALGLLALVLMQARRTVGDASAANDERSA